MNVNQNCVFCKIVAGAIPSVKLYEDDEFLAFMDIGPIVKGHTLVIPKQHYNPLTETPPEVLGRLIAIVQKIANAQLKGLKADGINVVQSNGAAAGQVVPHLHFHVIPRFHADGHSWNWKAKCYETPDEMKELAGKIQGAL
jgi:histidine triad (HIT) family protein